MSRTRSFGMFLLLGCFLNAASADDAADARSAELEAAKQKVTNRTYRLQYKLAEGEAYSTKVTHLVTVETKIQGVTETARTRSISTKTWHVTDVDSEGNITFTYTIESANMWQQLTGRQEIRYDSQKDSDPPPEYKHVAESIGTPMASVTISPAGEIIDRKNARPQFNPGIGDLTIPLPDAAIKVGQQWATEGELPVRMPDMQIKRIRIRQVYKLEKVETGVATIAVQTQILTPINEPKVESQLVQRIKRGQIKFDIDAGRVMSQQMDVDETVIGFSGADSLMKYLSRLSEEQVKSESVASKPAATAR